MFWSDLALPAKRSKDSDECLAYESVAAFGLAKREQGPLMGPSVSQCSLCESLDACLAGLDVVVERSYMFRYVQA